jgi:hypothetical protein
MATISKSRLTLAVGIPALIFTACTLITFSAKFHNHSSQLTVGIILDLLLIAPLTYYFVIRNTSVSKMTVLRVFMAGTIVATLILSKSDSQLLSIIKTRIAPLIEISIVGFIIVKFYTARKNLKSVSVDFLIHCRAILNPVFGNEKIANMIASEAAVFYYSFSGKKKVSANEIHFTSYKKTGVIIVLNTFFCLFISETIGMHFIFQLWNKTAAWILTGLSIYTCMQLFAHIRSLKIRTTILTENELLIRHGLLGGDVLIALTNIASIEESDKPLSGAGVVNMAFIKGLENIILFFT